MWYSQSFEKKYRNLETCFCKWELFYYYCRWMSWPDDSQLQWVADLQRCRDEHFQVLQWCCGIHWCWRYLSYLFYTDSIMGWKVTPVHWIGLNLVDMISNSKNVLGAILWINLELKCIMFLVFVSFQVNRFCTHCFSGVWMKRNFIHIILDSKKSWG